jgi:hypothetical protein
MSTTEPAPALDLPADDPDDTPNSGDDAGVDQDGNDEEDGPHGLTEQLLDETY